MGRDERRRGGTPSVATTGGGIRLCWSLPCHASQPACAQLAKPLFVSRGAQCGRIDRLSRQSKPCLTWLRGNAVDSSFKPHDAARVPRLMGAHARPGTHARSGTRQEHTPGLEPLERAAHARPGQERALARHANARSGTRQERHTLEPLEAWHARQERALEPRGLERSSTHARPGTLEPLERAARQERALERNNARSGTLPGAHTLERSSGTRQRQER